MKGEGVETQGEKDGVQIKKREKWNPKSEKASPATQPVTPAPHKLKGSLSYRARAGDVLGGLTWCVGL